MTSKKSKRTPLSDPSVPATKKIMTLRIHKNIFDELEFHRKRFGVKSMNKFVQRLFVLWINSETNK